MILEFMGNDPRTKFLRIGVNGNNLVDDLVFIIGRKQGKNDLFEFTPKIKIVTKEGDFAEYSGDDLIVEHVEERDTVKITYVLPKLITERGNVDMQLVFEKLLDNETVKQWQTLPFNVTFPESINESEAIIVAYPNIVRELKEDTQKAVDDSAAAVETANEAKETADEAKETSENAVATANEAKEIAESVVGAEINREIAEAARVAAESDRASAETNRGTAETARATAENDRASAETARGTAEAARAAAETDRQSAETDRASAETARETAETARAAAETDRASAESDRASAETARGTAEAERVAAETARASAETARDTAETARASAEGARRSAETARGTAETARASAETTRQSNEANRVSAETARAAAETAREEAEEEREQALEEYAKKDGFYEGMTVGHALVANTIARSVNSAIRETFLCRATGGSADIASESPAKYNYLEGKTWYENQLVKLRGTVTVVGVTITNNGDGSITLNGTATDENYLNLCDSSYPINYIQGHEYLLKGGVDTVAEISAGSLSITSTWVGNTPAIFTANSSASNGYIRVRIVNGTQYNNIRIFPELIDLTEWYCHEVPENLTVAQFQAEFGSKYIPQNNGTWRNALPSGIKTVNKNLLNLDRTEIVTSSAWSNKTIRNFNENQIWVGLSRDNYFNNSYITSWSKTSNSVTVLNNAQSGYGIGFPVRCLPNTEYYKDVDSVGLSFYDANGTILAFYNEMYTTATSPSNAYWMCVIVAGSAGVEKTVENPIVNLSYSSYNGIYEPHKSASFPFANLGDGLNKARNAVDMSWVVTETDGQTITYTQHVKTVVARVDLGTLNWTVRGGSGSFPAVTCFQTTGLLNLIKKPTTSADIANISCAKYMSTSWSILGSHSTDKLISVASDGYLNIRDLSYETDVDFKAAMSGVYLYFELAEPVETTYTVSADWSCTAWDLGTEEFTFGSGATPVALTIKTLYNWNVNDFLKNVNKNFLGMTDGTLAKLISAFASAGFTVSATFDASQNHYTWTVTNDRVPVLPSGDGTYKLVGTVSGGTKSYSWEAEQ